VRSVVLVSYPGQPAHSPPVPTSWLGAMTEHTTPDATTTHNRHESFAGGVNMNFAGACGMRYGGSVACWHHHLDWPAEGGEGGLGRRLGGTNVVSFVDLTPRADTRSCVTSTGRFRTAKTRRSSYCTSTLLPEHCVCDFESGRTKRQPPHQVF